MSIDKEELADLKSGGQSLDAATEQDKDLLGPFKHLPGVWKNVGSLEGAGWNMIALPFETRPDSVLDYRLLLNRYNETLVFDIVAKGVPNRGLTEDGKQLDQSVVTLDYQQITDQIAVDDFPRSSDEVRGPTTPPKNTIHHEPGLFLHMLDQQTQGFDIARLGTVPHGDSVLALGKSKMDIEGPPDIPDVSGLPIKIQVGLDHFYLEPYKHFSEFPFEGQFNPVTPAEMLKRANEGVEIARTTELDFDTQSATGGIENIPFVVKQANASSMRSIFWIQEIADDGDSESPKLRLQYLQVVMLDFDPRTFGLPGRIVWPHISLNTLEKVAGPPTAKLGMWRD